MRVMVVVVMVGTVGVEAIVVMNVMVEMVRTVGVGTVVVMTAIVRAVTRRCVKRHECRLILGG